MFFCLVLTHAHLCFDIPNWFRWGKFSSCTNADAMLLSYEICRKKRLHTNLFASLSLSLSLSACVCLCARARTCVHAHVCVCVCVWYTLMWSIYPLSKDVLYVDVYFFSPQIWKGFAQRRKTRKEREEEMMFIGMVRTKCVTAIFALMYQNIQNKHSYTLTQFQCMYPVGKRIRESKNE